MAAVFSWRADSASVRLAERRDCASASAERRAVTRMLFLIPRPAPGVNGLVCLIRPRGGRIVDNTEESKMAETIQLSEAAVALLRLHAKLQGRISVDDSNREAYRELARAGLMDVGHSFTRGRESFYRFTEEGWRLAQLPSPSEADALPH